MAPKVNQLKFGAVLSYASLAIGVVVSLVYTPIMLQRLGTQEFGVYNLVLPIVSYLNLLSFGLGSTYTRYYSRCTIFQCDFMISLFQHNSHIGKIRLLYLYFFTIHISLPSNTIRNRK